MTAPNDVLLLDLHEKVAVVTLNRPEVGNAFNEAIRTGLPALLGSP